MLKQILKNGRSLSLAGRVLRWHLDYLIRRRARPLACGFYITSRCNFRCEFCNIWRIEPPFEAGEGEAKELVASLGKLKLVYFSVSGGEPLLVPYLFRLMAFAKQNGVIYTHFVSNGYLLDDATAKQIRLADVSEVSFSLDADAQNHDRRRKVEGAYAGVVAAVERLKLYAPRTQVVLNAIFDPLFPEGALQAVKAAEAMRVEIKVQPVNRHPDFAGGRPAIEGRRSFSDEEKERINAALNVLLKRRSVVNSRAFLENYRAFLFAPEKLLFSREKCIFGYHHIEFFSHQAFPCLEGMGWQGGFVVKDTELASLIKSAP